MTQLERQRCKGVCAAMISHSRNEQRKRLAQAQVNESIIQILGGGCYPEGCAAPGDVQCQCNAQGSLSKLERAPSQRKINVTSKSPVGDISVVTLIRTDTTLDHSQKAEKV